MSGVPKSFSGEYAKKLLLVKYKCGLTTAQKTKRRAFEMNDNKSLAHTTWNCKYHIVFAPKYRRQIFYGEHRVEVGKILRELCEWKGITIIEAEVCPNHIHMLVEIPPKESVSGFMGYLKGKNRSFWCRGYYVDTVGKNKKKIAEYIQNQLKEDQLHDQLTLKEYMDPFTGSK